MRWRNISHSSVIRALHTLIDNHAFVINRHGHELDIRSAEGFSSSEVAGIFQPGNFTGIEQDACSQIPATSELENPR